jgi:hypothetical protein
MIDHPNIHMRWTDSAEKRRWMPQDQGLESANLEFPVKARGPPSYFLTI